MTIIYAKYTDPGLLTADWNNVTSFSGTGQKTVSYNGSNYTTLRDSAGADSGVSLYFDAAFTEDTGSGLWADTSPNAWPVDLYEWAYYSNGTPQMRLTGLPVGATFTLKLAGHSNNAGRDTNFTSLDAGNSPQLYDNLASTTPTAPVSLTGTVPANGEVRFSGALVSTFWYINGFELEFVGGASGPTITDVDTDNDVTAGQTGVIVTCTGAGAAQGAGSITITSPSGLTTITQTIDSWSDTGPAFTVVNISGDSALPFKSGQTLTLTDSAAAADTHLITVSPPAGTTVVDVVDPLSDATSIYQDATPAVATGDETRYEVDEGTDVVVAANGTMTASSATAVIRFRIWDATDETISAEYTATLNDGVVSVGGSFAMVLASARSMVNNMVEAMVQ